VKFAFSYIIDKRAHFVFFAGNLNFHASVWQVPDPPDYVEASGDVAHGETEPDALDATFIKHLKGSHPTSEPGIGYL
jgi:hypothetical protein